MKKIFGSVCIKLVALHMNLDQEVDLSFKKVCDPCLKWYAMQFSLVFVRLRPGCCKYCLYWYVLKTVF